MGDRVEGLGRPHRRPWPISRSIDGVAEFLFVKSEEALATAEASGDTFRCGRVELGHHGEELG